MSHITASPLPMNRRQSAAPAVAVHNNSLFLAGGLGVFMATIIAVTVATDSAAIALASIPIFAIAILFCCAGGNIPAAIAIYLAYAAMEGMFKYITDFSQAVYVVKPILAIIIFFGWCMARRKSGAKSMNFPLGGVIALFIAWGVFEIFNPLGSGAISGLITLMVWYVIPLVFYVISYNSTRSPQQVISLLYTLVAICTVVSAFAFVQYSMGREWTIAHVPGYNHLSLAMWIGKDSTGVDVTSFRPASTTAAEGFGTLWSNMGALAAFGLMLLPGVSSGRKIGLLGCLLINIGGLIVSGVRLFVLISMLEVVMILFLTSTSALALRRNLIAAVLVLGVAWVGFNAAQNISNGAIASRYAATLANPYAKYKDERQGGFTGQSAWLTDFLVQNPFGIGYQRGIGGKGGEDDTSASKIVMNRETQFAAISDDMGVFGLAFFSLLVVAMLALGYKAFRRLKGIQTKILGALLMTVLVGYTIGYWGGQMLVAVGDYIWLFAGTLFAVPLLERREQAMPAASSSAKARGTT